jgi:hypothetical protein
MMPVPEHLQACLVAPRGKPDSRPLKGKVRCPCGGKVFRLLFPGQTKEWGDEIIPCVAKIKSKYFLVIKGKCVACRKVHLLLDKDFHGWNGFVCRDPKQTKLKRPPLVPWKCLDCGELGHKAVLEIHTMGKRDFVDETDGEFDPALWPEAFAWFSMDIECVGCRKKSREWISYETM